MAWCVGHEQPRRGDSLVKPSQNIFELPAVVGVPPTTILKRITSAHEMIDINPLCD
jgi:hypothetical protein